MLVPQPRPEQRPIPKPRSDAFVTAALSSRHGADRAEERGYTAEQVAQTLAFGSETPDPKGDPNVRTLHLDSVLHRNMRRGLVVNVAEPRIVTVLPRQEIVAPQPRPKSRDQMEAERKRLRKQQKAAKNAKRNSGAA